MVSFPSEGVVDTEESDRFSDPGWGRAPFELMDWASWSSAMFWFGGLDVWLRLGN